MPRVADLVAQTLKAYGIDHYFFVTGGDQALWIALKEAGIRMIACRSEKAAAYMADGYARISGRPGLVYGQYGPGVSNVVAGLADPYWAMSPVISLTTSIRTIAKDRYEYQELDQLPLHTSVTRWNKAVVRPERAAEMVRAAIRAATASPPGPVHLEIPADMLREEVGPVPIYRERGFGQVPALRTAPPADAVEEALQVLWTARRPVILAGNGVMWSQGWNELVQLAESLGIPVATSMGGKGAIAEDHPLAVGVVGRYSRKVANDLVRQADVALVVGCRLGGLVTDTYTVPSPEAQIIHIDIDPTVLGATYREAVSIQADAKLALEQLGRAAAGRTPPAEWVAWAEQARAAVGQWWEAVRREAERPAGAPLHPAAVITTVRDALQPDDIVAADTGYMGAWTGALYPVRAPGRHYIRAAGSLGWAFPAAMGAALARPQRRTVCIIGDGGMGYHVGELETALRCRIPLITVILNNRSLAFEYHEQKYNWQNRIVPEVNDFVDIDYGAVARAYGAKGQRVETLPQLQAALHGALNEDTPTVLDVLVDKEVHGPVTVFESVLARNI